MPDLFDPFIAEQQHVAKGLTEGDIYWRSRTRTAANKHRIATTYACPQTGDLHGLDLAHASSLKPTIDKCGNIIMSRPVCALGCGGIQYPCTISLLLPLELTAGRTFRRVRRWYNPNNGGIYADVDAIPVVGRVSCDGVSVTYYRRLVNETTTPPTELPLISSLNISLALTGDAWRLRVKTSLGRLVYLRVVGTAGTLIEEISASDINVNYDSGLRPMPCPWVDDNFVFVPDGGTIPIGSAGELRLEAREDDNDLTTDLKLVLPSFPGVTYVQSHWSGGTYGYVATENSFPSWMTLF